MRLKGKILLGFAGVLVVLILLSVTLIYELVQVEGNIESVQRVSNVSAEVQKLSTDLNVTRILTRGLYNNEDFTAENEHALLNAFDELQKQVITVDDVLTNPENKDYMKVVQANVGTYVEGVKRALAHRRAMDGNIKGPMRVYGREFDEQAELIESKLRGNYESMYVLEQRRKEMALTRLAAHQLMAYADLSYKDLVDKRLAELVDGVNKLAPLAAREGWQAEYAILKKDVDGYATELPKLVDSVIGFYTQMSGMVPVSQEVSANMEKIRQSTIEIRQAALNNTRAAAVFSEWLSIVMSAIGIAIGLVIAWAIGRAISVPIAAMTGAMQDLAHGNLNAVIPGQDRVDEIGEMAQAVQVFKDNAIANKRLENEQKRAQEAREARAHRVEELIQGFDAVIKEALENAVSATGQMHTMAQEVSGLSEGTMGKCSVVANSTDQASQNVEAVASAAEELSASINEISAQVTQSNTIAHTAAREAEQTNLTVKNLAEISNRIGDVVNLITDIASQTNLLALNATIEAARAGEAGKGFAVVANEVKSLANQTARATEEIATQIAQVQEATQSAVVSIGGIVNRISEVEKISSDIAQAMEQQSAATQEISSNVQQASAGTREVSEEISDVLGSANKTGSAAQEVLLAVDQVGTQAKVIQDEVGKFLSAVRQA